VVDLPSGRWAAGLRDADSADDLLPLKPTPFSGRELVEWSSEALSGMAARSLTMSSIVLPRARFLPAPFPRRERGLASGLVVQATDAFPVAAFLGPLVSSGGWPDFGRAGHSCDLVWSVTLTGMVVRLFAVSRLLLSGLPLVARGWQEPSDDGWTNGWAGLLPRKRISLVTRPAACLLLMDFDTARLLHAGDHWVVKAALALLRRCSAPHDRP
jgi:hypothetical protein